MQINVIIGLILGIIGGKVLTNWIGRRINQKRARRRLACREVVWMHKQLDALRDAIYARKAEVIWDGGRTREEAEAQALYLVKMAAKVEELKKIFY